MDWRRLPLDVSVDSDTWTAIAHVPLRRQMLIPGAKVLGVGRAGIGAVAPDCRIARCQRAVGDGGNRLAQRRHAERAMADRRQVLGAHLRPEAGQTLQPGLGAEAIRPEQQPRAESASLEGYIDGGAL